MSVIAMRHYDGAEYIAPVDSAHSVHECLASPGCVQPARHRWRIPLKPKPQRAKAWVHTMLRDEHDHEFRKCQEGT